MSQLTCEVCGGTNLLKQEGVFVCQDCGCKYTVEEIRKRLQGSASASAEPAKANNESVKANNETVKTGSSNELDNLYQIARRAKDDNNAENAAKYYDMVLVKDPTSWEAYFYVVYFKAQQCKIGEIRSAANSVTNCEDTVLAMIRDYVPEEKQFAAVTEVAARCAVIATMLAKAAQNHYEGIDSGIKSNYTQEYVNNVCANRDVMYNCGDQIEKIFGTKPEIAKVAAEAWKTGLMIHSGIFSYFDNKEINRKTMESYDLKIGRYDPAYAKQHLYESKKAGLESEISSLKLQIKNTPTEAKWNQAGTVIIVIGLIVVFGITAMYGINLFHHPLLLIILLAIVLVPGYFVGHPFNTAVIKANKTKVSELQKTLAQKEAELAELKKGHESQTDESGISYGTLLGEKSDCTLHLNEVGPQKVQVIKLIRDLVPGMTLEAAKNLVETAPQTLPLRCTAEEAAQIRDRFTAAGAGVEIR